MMRQTKCIYRRCHKSDLILKLYLFKMAAVPDIPYRDLAKIIRNLRIPCTIHFDVSYIIADELLKIH